MKKEFKFAPLSSTFVLTSILGFLISVMFIIPKLSVTWGFTFAMMFMIMFLSSMVSMTRATTDDYHLDHLAVHEPEKHLKHIYKKKPKKTS
jgi:hypothetical protein